MSWNRLVVKMVIYLWNLTDSSTAMPSSRLTNYRAMWKLSISISRLRELTAIRLIRYKPPPPPPPAPNTTHTRTHPAHTFEIEYMRHNSISEGNFIQILFHEKLKTNDHSIFLSCLPGAATFFKQANSIYWATVQMRYWFYCIDVTRANIIERKPFAQIQRPSSHAIYCIIFCKVKRDIDCQTWPKPTDCFPSR